MGDYVTVLLVRSPRDAMMTKRLRLATNGTVYKVPYDRAFRFDVQKHAVNDLSDLAELLIKLSNHPQRVVIRGLPLSHHNVCRRLEGRQDGAFRMDPNGHHWMMLDFDEVRLPAMLDADDDPDLITGFLVRQLPPAFHNTSYFWQWSCGHGLDRAMIRAHLFFWSERAHTDKEYKRWAEWINGQRGEKLLDCSVFETVQPNYTAAPILEDGVVDPCAIRNGIVLGDADEVVLNIPAIGWREHLHELDRTEIRETGQQPPPQPTKHDPEQWRECMTRIGDDHDGFHEPMRQTIYHWAITHSPSEDAEFKSELRHYVHAASNQKHRNLDQDYLAEHLLDNSLAGARRLLPNNRGLQTPFMPKLTLMARS